MSVRFRLLTESDVKAVLTMDDLIRTMSSALGRFSKGEVTQPVRTVITVGSTAFCALMPAFVPEAAHPAGSPGGENVAANIAASLGAKLVTVFGGNAARGLPSHLASILLLDPGTGALLALIDGRFITEARTAAVSAVSSRLLARAGAASLAIIGSGVQARSHLEALSRVHRLKHVAVWSPTKAHRDRFVAEAQQANQVQPRSDLAPTSVGPHADRDRTAVGARSESSMDTLYTVRSVDHAGEAIVGADLIVLATSSPMPVLENGWVKPGAHVISVGACRPVEREMDPQLVTRARLFVDSRPAALVESGDVILAMQEGRFGADHIVAELGELVNGATGRRTETEITIFKSLGMAVEDVTAANLAYRRALERGIGTELTL
jgi:alanine dehydrogenase